MVKKCVGAQIPRRDVVLKLNHVGKRDWEKEERLVERVTQGSKRLWASIGEKGQSQKFEGPFVSSSSKKRVWKENGEIG